MADVSIGLLLTSEHPTQLQWWKPTCMHMRACTHTCTYHSNSMMCGVDMVEIGSKHRYWKESVGIVLIS